MCDQLNIYCIVILCQEENIRETYKARAENYEND